MARALRFGWLSIPWVVAGCITPWNTRLPTVAPSPPWNERRSYQVHDPFPEDDLGPETQVRPREYIEPRDEQVRIRQGRALLGMPGQSAPSGPILPPSTYRYPDSVTE